MAVVFIVPVDPIRDDYVPADVQARGFYRFPAGTGDPYSRVTPLAVLRRRRVRLPGTGIVAEAGPTPYPDVGLHFVSDYLKGALKKAKGAYRVQPFTPG